MPNTIYEYLNEDGEIIRIQVQETSDRVRGGRGNTDATLQRVETSFEKALGTVKTATKGLKKVINEVSPDEAKVEFSIKAAGEAGLFTICKATTGAEFKITLTWKKEKG